MSRYIYFLTFFFFTFKSSTIDILLNFALKKKKSQSSSIFFFYCCIVFHCECCIVSSSILYMRILVVSHFFVITNNATMTNLGPTFFSCMLSEVYLQSRFLEMRLLGQKVSAYVVLSGTARLFSRRLYQFALSLALYERAFSP